MSEIDGGNHLIVGYFRRIPVYEPLEPIHLGIQSTMSGTPNCGPGKLVIGGGAGEHPAIVFHRLDFIVARLLASSYSPVSEQATSEIFEFAHPQGMTVFDQNILEYCDWDSEDHRRFYDFCKGDYESSGTMDLFRDESDAEEDEDDKPLKPMISFETWLTLVVAEFVYISLPTINEKVAKWRMELGAPRSYWFMGITVPPVNYPVIDSGQASLDEDVRTRGEDVRWKVEDRWPGRHACDVP